MKSMEARTKAALVGVVLLSLVGACTDAAAPDTVKDYPYTTVIGDVELGFKTHGHMIEFIAWSKTWGYPCDNLAHFKLPADGKGGA